VSFREPWALAALALVPLLALVFVARDRRRHHVAERFASAPLLPGIAPRPPRARRWLPLAVLLAALAAMIVGVARPEATLSHDREEATIVLAVDVSRSMQAADVEPSRLVAARAAAGTFVANLPERFRVAVIGIGSRAVIASPPTEDRRVTEEALGLLEPSEGTALGDGVALAVQLSQKERAADGTIPPTAVLLISDGARDGGQVEPRTAAARAKRLGIPVHAILVGTPEGFVEVELEGGYTQRIQVPTDPETLRMFAQTTGGELYTALDDERLAQVYEELGSRLGAREERREVTDLFAGGAAALLLAGGALSVLWLRRLP
jgi:Ca-activated chloride channel family protein